MALAARTSSTMLLLCCSSAGVRVLDSWGLAQGLHPTSCAGALQRHSERGRGRATGGALGVAPAWRQHGEACSMMLTQPASQREPPPAHCRPPLHIPTTARPRSRLCEHLHEWRTRDLARSYVRQSSRFMPSPSKSNHVKGISDAAKRQEERKCAPPSAGRLGSQRIAVTTPATCVRFACMAGLAAHARGPAAQSHNRQASLQNDDAVTQWNLSASAREAGGCAVGRPHAADAPPPPPPCSAASLSCGRPTRLPSSFDTSTCPGLPPFSFFSWSPRATITSTLPASRAFEK